jgi:hypothetical protein
VSRVLAKPARGEEAKQLSDKDPTMIAARKMSSRPLISLVMSTYNGEKFLVQAIRSLLNQTVGDFELVVVDDCSTDYTVEILKSLQDKRLVVSHNSSNLGIGASLNRALQAARGEFIAVQDHDDVSLPTRFEEQVRFLDTHPEVVLVGSPAWVIDENDTRKGLWKVPFDDVELRWQLLVNEPFLHTSIMMRRRALEDVGGYSTDPQYRFAEDYELISRIAATYPVANLREPIVSWREHDRSASELNQSQQEQAVFKISLRNMRMICPGIDPAMRRSIQVLLQTKIGDEVSITSKEAWGTIACLESLLESFYRKHHFREMVVRGHRKHVHWILGKHLLALAYRGWGRRDLSCRASLLACGTKLLSNTFRKLSSRDVHDANPC